MRREVQKKKYRSLWLIMIAVIMMNAASCAEKQKEAETDNSPETPKETTVFDLERRSVLLNNGVEMPVAGLGTYALDHDTCVASVMTHLKEGGRLIDTAYMYHNEDAVGEGVRRAMQEYGIPREEIFVITRSIPRSMTIPKPQSSRPYRSLISDI